VSAMGDKTLEVDQDIYELLQTEKSDEEIEDIIAEVHGEMFRGRVNELIMENFENDEP
jgi:predicted CopG family antitoxin